MAFEVRVPTGKGGGKVSGNAIGGGFNETNKLLKKLDKSILGTIDIGELLMQAFGDLIKVIQPLFKILSLLFLIIFLPLLPLLTLLIKGIASLAKLFSGGFGNIAGMIAKFLLGLLILIFLPITGPIMLIVAGLLVIALMFPAIWEAIKFIGEQLANIAVWLWEKLTQAFTFLIDFIIGAGNWLWEAIKSGFSFILGIGKKIWEWFKSGLSFITDLGQKIWNVIWNGLKNLGSIIIDGFKKILNSIINFINIVPGISIPHLANGGIVTSPTTALIGEAGPEAVIPLNKLGGMGTTININNPTVRDDRDIRKMTDAISRELQKRGNRGFSSL